MVKSGEYDKKEFDHPIIPAKTEAALEDIHPRARSDYESWKRGFLTWISVAGKKPIRQVGYADGSVRKVNYQMDQIMRWLWDQRGYTTELTPEDADEYMKLTARHGGYTDANLGNFVKTIKRIFKYYNTEKGADIEWTCKVKLNEPKVTNRDYFTKDEFRPLYEAALNHGAVKHYNNCTIEEREQLKSHLAQRFKKPTEEITPHDFQRANSFKIPSLVAVSLDCGLRPVEVRRATVGWVNAEKGVLQIPADDSSKNRDNWECVLQSRTVRCLEKWIQERSTYGKYESRNALWLNQRGNKYQSYTLNYLLDQLIEEAGIEPAGRDLTWYSIRHGVATLWADEEDIHHAKEQLRHKQVKTTLGYAHSGTNSRTEAVENKY